MSNVVLINTYALLYSMSLAFSWNHRDTNVIAESMAKFSLCVNYCIAADEFSFCNLPVDIVNSLLYNCNPP